MVARRNANSITCHKTLLTVTKSMGGHSPAVNRRDLSALTLRAGAGPLVLSPAPAFRAVIIPAPVLEIAPSTDNILKLILFCNSMKSISRKNIVW